MAPNTSNDAVGAVIGALYARIVIMQIAVIAGAMLAQHYSSMAPLLIVIGLKTLTDMSWSIRGSRSFKGVTVSSGNTSMTT